MSFCLIGMNTADMYDMDKQSYLRIVYNRVKTRSIRHDKARMEVDVPNIIKPLLIKYRDKTGEKMFCFHNTYRDSQSFNKAVNYGLKEIGELLGIDDLEFYAARHTWATLAINEVGIDKYTVHSALNHIDPSMRVTDIYIQRNFAIENIANKKVLNYVFGDNSV